eukprot:m.201823 g.201823  ORF g.201823 m.201823 type:complete len:78 (-) comp15508_c4_seq15:820-1053(-)
MPRPMASGSKAVRTRDGDGISFPSLSSVPERAELVLPVCQLASFLFLKAILVLEVAVTHHPTTTITSFFTVSFPLLS